GEPSRLLPLAVEGPARLREVAPRDRLGEALRSVREGTRRAVAPGAARRLTPGVGRPGGILVPAAGSPASGSPSSASLFRPLPMTPGASGSLRAGSATARISPQAKHEATEGHRTEQPVRLRN